MKKMLVFILALFLLVSLSGCNTHNRDLRELKFYYRNAEIDFDDASGVIRSEKRYLSKNLSTEEFLGEYLKGPKSSTLEDIFPAGTKLIRLTFENAQIRIVLSDQIAKLSGADLTLTCVCLQKTISELTGIQTVQIAAENEKLNGQDVITLTPESIFLYDDGHTMVTP